MHYLYPEDVEYSCFKYSTANDKDPRHIETCLIDWKISRISSLSVLSLLLCFLFKSELLILFGPVFSF